MFGERGLIRTLRRLASPETPPRIEVKVPTLVRPSLRPAPIIETGPLGIIRIRAASPGELSPVNFSRIKGARERGFPTV